MHFQISRKRCTRNCAAATTVWPCDETTKINNGTPFRLNIVTNMMINIEMFTNMHVVQIKRCDKAYDHYCELYMHASRTYYENQ